MFEKLSLSAARAGLAAIFLISGWSKLGALEGTAEYVAAVGMPFPTLAVLGAAALELGAGFALLAGWRLAVSAGALALFSVVTAVLFHADFSDENQAIHFWKNVAMAGGLAHVALADWLRGRGAAPAGLLA
jgi:putative oxidoreductase